MHNSYQQHHRLTSHQLQSSREGGHGDYGTEFTPKQGYTKGKKGWGTGKVAFSSLQEREKSKTTGQVFLL